MKFFAKVFVLSLLWLGIAAAPEDTDCLKNNKPCSNNLDCCFGCCSKERCVPYTEGCNKDENPCYQHECPPNQVCYLQKVQCVAAPCPPIPVCRPIDPDYD